MTVFSHVTNKRIRTLLEQENLEHVVVGDIDYVLQETLQALNADRNNPLLRYEVIDAREAALYEADDAYQEGQKEAAVLALRKFWSV